MDRRIFDTIASLAPDVLQAIKSAIVIVDARADDLPIVYANPAFETLTGFKMSDVIGRNCRFLQGPATNLDIKSRIKLALQKCEPIHETLINYRKDGSPFQNEVFIAPIRNRSGVVTYFVGCQNAVEDERQASLRAEAAQRYGTLSVREQEVFKGLVRGTPMKEIAAQAGLSTRTIEKYRYRMQRKMGHKSLTMLVRYAIVLGIPLE